MLLYTYYAQNYAGIIGGSLLWSDDIMVYFVDSKQPRNPQKFEPLKINYTVSDQGVYQISSNSDIIGRQSLGLLVIIFFGSQLVAM